MTSFAPPRFAAGLLALLASVFLLSATPDRRFAPAPAPPGGPPEGTIVLWTAPLAEIPQGWSLCDGSLGTADLTDRFVLGAPADAPAGELGGSHQRSLALANLPGHSHSLSLTDDGSAGHQHEVENVVEPITTYWTFGNVIGGYSTEFPVAKSTFQGGNHTHSGMSDGVGDGQAFDNRPAFTRVAFIQKGPRPTTELPPGVIMLWPDRPNRVPDGWRVCNGVGGTPDLLDRFLLSVRPDEDPGEDGGADWQVLAPSALPHHEHGFTSSSSGAHSHTFTETDTHVWWNIEYYGGLIVVKVCNYTEVELPRVSAPAGKHGHTGSLGNTGSGAAFDNRPGHLGLVPIMHMGDGGTGQAPPGAIALWSGSRRILPADWRECDGGSERPDLRDRFVRAQWSPGLQGGDHQRSLEGASVPSHGHGLAPSAIEADGEHSHDLPPDLVHPFPWDMDTGGLHTYPYAYPVPYVQSVTTSTNAWSHGHGGQTDVAGASEPFDNRPAFARVIFMIRQ